MTEDLDNKLLAALAEPVFISKHEKMRYIERYVKAIDLPSRQLIALIVQQYGLLQDHAAGCSFQLEKVPDDAIDRIYDIVQRGVC